MNYLSLLVQLPLTQGVFLLITIISFIGVVVLGIYGKIKGQDVISIILKKQTTMLDLSYITILSVIVIMLQTAYIYYNVQDKNMSDDEIIDN